MHAQSRALLGQYANKGIKDFSVEIQETFQGLPLSAIGQGQELALPLVGDGGKPLSQRQQEKQQRLRAQKIADVRGLVVRLVDGFAQEEGLSGLLRDPNTQKDLAAKLVGALLVSEVFEGIKSPRERAHLEVFLSKELGVLETIELLIGSDQHDVLISEVLDRYQKPEEDKHCVVS
jgi:hypothetical protein